MRTQPSSVALLAAGLLLAAAPSLSERDCCPVLELRQYTLKPGQRNVLIELFDRHFVESQEATGMTIVGQFRDRRRADRFVWVRGFADMQTRHRALEAFYGGPVWAEHKAAANATMVDVSDVCLLKPAGPETSFHLDITDRPKPGEVRGSAIVAVGIHRLQQAADAGVLSQFQQHVVPALRRERVFIQSVFVTESAPNTFARLPVREGEHLLVWFGTAQNGEPPTEPRLLAATAGLSAHADGPASFLELEPTPRSLLGRDKRP